MSNALALKTLSLKTGKPALRLAERLQDNTNIIRAMNKRLKRPYAKKGWWWSGLWDPSAKNRKIVESIKLLFEKMVKKTYEEKHTYAKNEEMETEHKFQIHSQNVDIEISILHITHPEIENAPKEKSSKINKIAEKSSWQDNVIELVGYKKEKIKQNADTAASEPNSVPVDTKVQTESADSYQIKVKKLPSNDDNPVFNNPVQERIPINKDPETAEVEATALICTASEVAQIISSLINNAAKQSVNSERSVEISIGSGIIPNLFEIFVEEATPAVTTPQIAIRTQNTDPVQDIIQPQQNTQTISQIAQAPNTKDPEPEELVVPPVEIPQVAQPIINNILFFPAVQQIKIDAVEAMPLQTHNSGMQEIQMQEEIPVASVLVQPIIVIPFSIQTAPLLEEIMIESPSLQKTSPVSNPKKDSSITVFFSKGNNGIKLKQTDAEASPED